MTFPRSFLIGLFALAAPAVGAAQAPLSPHDLMLLNRVTWGATPADAAQMQALGPKRWLERQLHPSADPGLPPQVKEVIADLEASQHPVAELLATAQERHMAFASLTDPEQKQAGARAFKQYLADRQHDAIVGALMRDVYSQNQLQEQMTWFWFNHFNVFSHKRDIRAMLADYQDNTLRPHALGRFRDLVEATLRHPAMLRYLDNDQNASGKINENYARELMELHTMGVGSGYAQKDVQELARILTGLGVKLKPGDAQMSPELEKLYFREGDVVFNPKLHDFGDKVLLGHRIKGAGYAEIEQALDILCRQPATAHHISLQLAEYFVGDDPPPALVERMAQTFQRSDGDIAEVLKTMFDSREFDASLGTQFKDPMHYVVSAVRLGYGDKQIVNVNPMIGWLIHLSEGLYDHETPDGYPLTSAAWNGPGQLAARFEVARQMASPQPGFFIPPNRDPVGPAEPPQLQPDVQKIDFERSLGPSTLQVLGQAGTPREWNALFLSSPEFMHR